jgi:autotransporter-associated beta strand protein
VRQQSFNPNKLKPSIEIEAIDMRTTKPAPTHLPLAAGLHRAASVTSFQPARAVAAVAASLLLLAAGSARAADGNWTNDAAGNWSDATKWSSNPTVPGTAAGDTVGLNNDITADRTVTIDTASRTVGTLNLGDEAEPLVNFTLAANGGAFLAFNNKGSGAAISKTGGSSGDSISSPLFLADNLTATVTAGVLTISGDTSGSGSLTKDGSEDMIMSGNNTYGGGTTINDGRLHISFPSSLPPRGAVQVNGGTLNLNAVGTYKQSITLASGGALATRAVCALGNVTLPTSGTVTLNLDDSGTAPMVLNSSVALTGDLTVNVGGKHDVVGNVTITGAISGGSGLIKSTTGSVSTGALILSGNNTYSGATTISSGSLIGVAGGSCSNSAVTVNNTAGCTLGVRVNVNTKQWTCASLTSAGANANLAFGFRKTPSTNLAPLKVTRDLTLTGTPTLTVDPANLVAGKYPILVYGGNLVGTAPTTATIGRGLSGTLAWGDGTTYSTKTLVLTVTGTSTSPINGG